MPTEDHVAHNNPYSPLTRPLKQLPVATTLAPWLRAGTQTHYWKQKCSVQYLAHLVLRRCKTCSMKYVMVSCEDVSASCNTNLSHTNHRIQASHHCLICVYSRTAPCGTSRRFMRLETGASKKRMPMEATDVNDHRLDTLHSSGPTRRVRVESISVVAHWVLAPYKLDAIKARMWMHL